MKFAVPDIDLVGKINEAITAVAVGGMSKKLAFLNSPGCFFAHYTSAETSSRILASSGFYMRNSRLMNDQSEVWHGFTSVLNAFRQTEGGKAYIEAWRAINGSLGETLADLMEPYANAVIQDCYILSVCEHEETSNKDGLLSMWRAYGTGDIRIAIVGKPYAVSPVARSGVFLAPCLYGDMEAVGRELGHKADALNRNRQVFLGIDPKQLKTLATNITATLAVSIKHPGFEEEKEWRFVYMANLANPEMDSRKEVVVWGGVPQTVYKLPFFLPNSPEFDPSRQFIDSVILGPCSEKLTVRAGLVALLEKYGFKNAGDLVRISGIPYRQRM